MNATSNPQSPTNIRLYVVGVTTLTSFLLYLDRFSVQYLAKNDSVRQALSLSDADASTIQSAFFLAYALFQVPAGWLSDRFGARGMMALYVALWSLFVFLMGFGTAFLVVALCSFGAGLAQAGAYPTSSGLLSRWVTYHSRGLASSVVAFGGRVGGVFAPVLAGYLIAALGSWRPVFWLFGVVGLVVAWMFWAIFRNRPELHPRVNQAECDLIEHSRPADVQSPHGKATKLPLLALIRSRSMTLNSTAQFFTNVGWAFLIQNLGPYLQNVKKIGEKEKDWMVTTVFLVGMAGMLFGGRLTDTMTRRLGMRWGRSLPVSGSRFLAAAAFFACLWLDTPWIMVMAFAVVAFATDLGGPAAWAYAQDAGGKYVGSVLGWGNMWGNLGAAFSPLMASWVLKNYDSNGDWSEVFIALGVSFVLSGIAAIGIDASIPIVPDSKTDGHD